MACNETLHVIICDNSVYTSCCHDSVSKRNTRAEDSHVQSGNVAHLPQQQHWKQLRLNGHHRRRGRRPSLSACGPRTGLPRLPLQRMLPLPSRRGSRQSRRGSRQSRRPSPSAYGQNRGGRWQLLRPRKQQQRCGLRQRHIANHTFMTIHNAGHACKYAHEAILQAEHVVAASECRSI